MDDVKLLDIVLVCLADNLGLDPSELEETTHLFGKEGQLDSLGLVELLMDIEQRLADIGVQITIADDRAMSQKHSPFATVETLTAYVALLAAE